jgi:PD-(D/E)XK nuclease superfamily
MKTKSLYFGSFRLYFDPRKHRYTVIRRGRTFVVPSVTTILSALREHPDADALKAADRWLRLAAKCRIERKPSRWPHQEVRLIFRNLPPTPPTWEEDRAFNVALRFLQAGKRGSAIHKWIEKLLRWQIGGRRTQPKPLSEYPGYCLAATRFLLNHEAQPLHIEEIVFSRDHWFAGTTDLICVMNGTLVLIDWKSSYRLRRLYDAQLAAYCRAFREQSGQRISSAVLVHLRSDGEFRMRHLGPTQLAREWQKFLRARKRYLSKHPLD